MHSFVEGRPELKCKPLCFPMKADWGSANTPDNPCAKGGANGVDPGWYELVKHPSIKHASS